MDANKKDLLKQGNVKYYYCSIETFFEIIKNKKIWFCDPLKMNDYDELFAYHNTIMRSTPKPERKKIEEYQKKLDLIKEKGQNRMFVICFSEEKDLLSQWMMYGDKGNGVAIGFDLEKLKIKNSYIELKKVTYINKYDKKLAEKVNKKPNINILEESISYKDKGFEQEKEYRLIYKKADSKNSNRNVNCFKDILPIKYSIFNNNDIKKHIELDINIDDINEIILGPKSNINKYELCEFIEDSFGKPLKGKTHSIHLSTITLR